MQLPGVLLPECVLGSSKTGGFLWSGHREGDSKVTLIQAGTIVWLAYFKLTFRVPGRVQHAAESPVYHSNCFV